MIARRVQESSRRFGLVVSAAPCAATFDSFPFTARYLMSSRFSLKPTLPHGFIDPAELSSQVHWISLGLMLALLWLRATHVHDFAGNHPVCGCHDGRGALCIVGELERVDAHRHLSTPHCVICDLLQQTPCDLTVSSDCYALLSDDVAPTIALATASVLDLRWPPLRGPPI